MLGSLSFKLCISLGVGEVRAPAGTWFIDKLPDKGCSARIRYDNEAGTLTGQIAASVTARDFMRQCGKAP